MIDRAEFAKVMGVFADRIGRAVAPATAEAYYATLSDALTTEEFLAGARIVFRTHKYNTWPEPQQFIDAVKPPAPVKLNALEAFEAVLSAVGSVYDPAHERNARIAALGPVAERAYRAAGGFREFVNLLESNLPFLRNRFVEAYDLVLTSTKQQDEATRALNAGDIDPRAGALVTATAHQLGSSPRDRALPPGDR